MGAKKSKRKIKFIAIACEGYTEVAYFKEVIKREKKLKAKACCTCVDGEQDPENFLDKAWEFYKKEVSSFRLLDEKNKKVHKDDSLFCVFDLDNKTSAQVNEFKRLAALRGVSLIRSDPAFELWFYLHFKDIEYADTCDQNAIFEKLKIEWPKYKKATPDKDMKYLKTLNEKESCAILRVNKIREKHIQEVSPPVFGVRTDVDYLLYFLKR